MKIHYIFSQKYVGSRRKFRMVGAQVAKLMTIKERRKNSIRNWPHITQMCIKRPQHAPFRFMHMCQINICLNQNYFVIN